MKIKIILIVFLSPIFMLSQDWTSQTEFKTNNIKEDDKKIILSYYNGLHIHDGGNAGTFYSSGDAEFKKSKGYTSDFGMKIPLSDNGYLDIRLSYIDYATDQTRIDSVGQWGWQGNQYIYYHIGSRTRSYEYTQKYISLPILYEHRYNVYDKIDLYAHLGFSFSYFYNYGDRQTSDIRTPLSGFDSIYSPEEIIYDDDFSENEQDIFEIRTNFGGGLYYSLLDKIAFSVEASTFLNIIDKTPTPNKYHISPYPSIIENKDITEDWGVERDRKLPLRLLFGIHYEL